MRPRNREEYQLLGEAVRPPASIIGGEIVIGDEIPKIVKPGVVRGMQPRNKAEYQLLGEAVRPQASIIGGEIVLGREWF